MNPKMRGGVLVLWLTVCLLAWGGPPAQAASRIPVVSRQTLTIRPHQILDSLLVVGHSVTVAGTVQNLVVWEGNVWLMPSGHVVHLLDIGGSVHRAAHATVGDLVVIGTNTAVGNTLLLGAGLTLGLAGLRTFLSVLFFLIPVLIGPALDVWLRPLVTVIEPNPRRIGVQGLLVSVAVLGMGTALALTLIGLPLSLLLGIAYLGAGVLGWAAVGRWVGTRVEAWFPARSRAFHTMVGAGVLVASMNLPVIGVFLGFGAWCLGIGSVTAILRRRYVRPRGGAPTA